MMSERWKYQIKTGSFYAIFMTIGFAVWESYTLSVEEAIFSKRFVLRLTAFLLAGIFFIGYMNWKAKEKKELKK